ncbi:glycosyltransferase family 2 protein [Paenibacillus taichungensis]
MSIRSKWKSRIEPALAGLLGIKTRARLKPISHLEMKNEKWISTGNDPSFLVTGRYFPGWNKIKWESESKSVIPLKMYWDQGNGFSESKSLTFSSIPKGFVKREVTVYIPPGTQNLRIDPGEDEAEFMFTNVRLKKTTRIKMVLGFAWEIIHRKGLTNQVTLQLLKKGFQTLRTSGLKATWSKFKAYTGHQAIGSTGSYESWVANQALTSIDIKRIKDEIVRMTYKPLISIIVPVYNVEEKWLRLCIDSVINQLYPNWELCIADDASDKPHIKKVLNEYAQKDSRIKIVFRDENGHISESSNSALDVATGEYIGLLDHDDELTINALYENVKLLNQHPEADIVYSDEDKISEEGVRHSPYFKPDWSPDLLLSQMYTCHFSIYRKSLVDQVGGFRKGYEGSQDYDLVLRVSELTEKIYHIPKILYHWRTIPESTASGAGAKNYTHYAGIKALKDTIQRRGMDAEVREIEEHPNMYRLHYNIVKEPLVTIIIPTKNLGEILDNCLSSIFALTTYNRFEILIVDNGSRERDTLDIFDKWTNGYPEQVKIVEIDIPFNYSKLNNLAVQEAKGEYLVLLNNDIEIISPNWINDMLGFAQRKNTGAVGAKLLYPDNTIQHSGVIMGLGGIAGHAFRTLPISDAGYFGALLVNRNCAVVTAACLMIEKAKYLEVEGMEEQLSVAFNDVDFCLKLLKKGYQNVCVNSVQLYHYESKTRGAEDTKEKQERFRREIEFMEERWAEIIKKDPYYNDNLSLKSDMSYSLNMH